MNASFDLFTCKQKNLFYCELTTFRFPCFLSPFLSFLFLSHSFNFDTRLHVCFAGFLLYSFFRHFFERGSNCTFFILSTTKTRWIKCAWETTNFSFFCRCHHIDTLFWDCKFFRFSLNSTSALFYVAFLYVNIIQILDIIHGSVMIKTTKTEKNTHIHNNKQINKRIFVHLFPFFRNASREVERKTKQNKWYQPNVTQEAMLVTKIDGMQSLCYHLIPFYMLCTALSITTTTKIGSKQSIGRNVIAMYFVSNHY